MQTYQEKKKKREVAMKKEEERTKAINKNITSIQDWFQLVQFPPDAGQLTTTRRKLTGEKRMAWTADLVRPRLGLLGSLDCPQTPFWFIPHSHSRKIAGSRDPGSRTFFGPN